MAQAPGAGPGIHQIPNGRRGTQTFFVVTFAFAWVMWGAAVALAASSDAPAVALLQTVVFHIGVFAPSIVAIALTARDDGRAGVEALLRRIARWRVSAGWYVFAAGYMVAIKLAAALVHRAVTGAWPRFGEEPVVVMFMALLVSTWVQAGEEIGWRGFALPRLAARIGLAPAGILLGAIWASWHLPLFFWRASDAYGQSFPLYLLQVTALSVAITWLYWRTGGSLLLTMLFHAAVNNTKDIVPSAAPAASNSFTLHASLVGWLTVGLLWICAAYFLVRMRGKSLVMAVN